ncbi:UNVERIFIED_CONTAM: protein phosphatase 2C 29 [Sesamum calycinum]|uniref:Protein phosphatase 2C 29 n=1 Tax=Sesamum calycinum TaxID=2727403 RepID=A0AAW2QYB1_9LAMI
MGAGFSQVFPCFNPAAGPNRSDPDVIFTANAQLDETLGHSFCYVRSSARFISPTQSDRFVSPSQSLRFDDPAHPRPSRPPGYPETGFRAISGASVGANTSTPITVLQLDDICDDAADATNSYHHNNATNSNSSKGFVGGPSRVGGNSVLLDGFESTSSFSALPLQRVPRGGEPPSGPLERAFFMSGPIERGALSGPLDGTASADNNGECHFRPPLVVFIGGGGRKDAPPGVDSCREAVGMGCESNEQWALGKAEDLVEGSQNADVVENSCQSDVNIDDRQGFSETKEGENESQLVKKVMFGGEQIEVRRRRLWEYLVEDDPEEGLDLSGSERFAFSVDDALSVNDAGSAGTRRSLLLSKLKHGLLNRNKDKESIRLFPWRFWLEGKQKAEEEMRESNVADDGETEGEN